MSYSRPTNVDNYCHLDYLHEQAVEATVEKSHEKELAANIRNSQLLETKLQRE